MGRWWSSVVDGRRKGKVTYLHMLCRQTKPAIEKSEATFTMELNPRTNDTIQPQSTMATSIQLYPSHSSVVIDDDNGGSSTITFDALIRISTPPKPVHTTTSQSPKHLMILLDVSGSMMSDNKFTNAIQACMNVVDRFGQCQAVAASLDEDQYVIIGANDTAHTGTGTVSGCSTDTSGYNWLSIITFSDHATVALNSMRLDANGVRVAKNSIQAIRIESSTNLQCGLKLAFDVVNRFTTSSLVTTHPDHLPNSFLWIMTDGNPTHGWTRPSQHVKYIESEMTKRTGINTTPSFSPRGFTSINTVGFGSDVDSSLLKRIADVGLGTYVYIESFDMIEMAVSNMLSSLDNIYAHSVELRFFDSVPESSQDSRTVMFRPSKFLNAGGGTTVYVASDRMKVLLGGAINWGSSYEFIVQYRVEKVVVPKTGRQVEPMDSNNQLKASITFNPIGSSQKIVSDTSTVISYGPRTIENNINKSLMIIPKFEIQWLSLLKSFESVCDNGLATGSADSNVLMKSFECLCNDIDKQGPGISTNPRCQRIVDGCKTIVQRFRSGNFKETKSCVAAASSSSTSASQYQNYYVPVGRNSTT